MSKQQKKIKSKQPSKPKSSFLTKYWQEKSSVFKFFAAFAVCILVFYAMYYSLFFEVYLKDPLLHAQASVSAVLLNLFGMSVVATGNMLAGPGVALEIAGGCDGLEATALLLAAILVSPIPFKYKWPGLLAGITVLSVLNVLRIAGLYLVQIYWPSAFEFMHVQGGLYLFSFFTILLLLIWANWALKGYKAEQQRLA